MNTFHGSVYIIMSHSNKETAFYSVLCHLLYFLLYYFVVSLHTTSMEFRRQACRVGSLVSFMSFSGIDLNSIKLGSKWFYSLIHLPSTHTVVLFAFWGFLFCFVFCSCCWFFYLLNLFLFICPLSVCHVCFGSPSEVEEGIWFPGAGVRISCERIELWYYA